MIVLNLNDLELVWRSWKLSDITQFSWSVIQTEWIPQMTICFGSLFSWLKYSKIWMWMMENENRILVFSKLENWNSVASSVDKMRLKALKPMHCHIKSQALGYYRWNFPISFHFNPKFSAKFFPLLTSLSQPLSHFHFPLHPQRASSMTNTPSMQQASQPN